MYDPISAKTYELRANRWEVAARVAPTGPDGAVAPDEELARGVLEGAEGPAVRLADRSGVPRLVWAHGPL